MRFTDAVAEAVVAETPYVCDVAVVAALSVYGDALPTKPTCPEPGRTAETPLLSVIAEAAASRVVVELTVLRTPADASRPEPVAVTTVVEAVAVVSTNLKYATPLTKFAFVKVADDA
jgi:hypothetical protein